jgi:GNAT superfamily N-acetyltransferase
MDLLMQSRLEMLRLVNELPCEYKFSKELLDNCREYFKSDNQTTILATDECVIGCATICYIEMMPTFAHPTGKRAHLMNVYTNSKYRRQGIALHMLEMLIKEAKVKGVTEISLDATELGKPLYKKCNFVESGECMVLNLT